ncbi:MAG TPA: methyl-accepting chemotaxis protein [Pirellulales bacterium]|nr:methyl-accepting chemotaxis protein [Pirellulales bacterium]
MKPASSRYTSGNGAAVAERPRRQKTSPGADLRGALEEANANTQAVLAVIEALGRAAAAEEAVKAALDAMRSSFGWAYGSYWAVDPKDKALAFVRESGTVNPEFQRVTASARFREGEGLPGRAWRQRDLFFTPDLGQMTDCCRAPAAQRAGVKSGVCFPIVVKGEVLGTMDFLALETRELSPERLEALRNIGRLASSAVERVEREVEAARMTSMTENMPINVICADREFKIRYMNPASLKQLKALEQYLPIKAEQIVGQSIDVFHKQPERQRQLLSDPKNLPHRAQIKVGPETLDLLASAIFDQNKNYIGPMVTWEVITSKLELEQRINENAEREKLQMEEMKGLVTNIAQNAQTLAGSSEELSSVSAQMGANAEETSAQANVVSAASEQVSKNVQTVATGIEEMSASIKEIAKNASDAAKVASSAVAVAHTANSTIGKLGESSAEIGKVIKVITSIAEQTNLLALNATIEAARAGEAGKGFAVVANEVKELAKETARATEDISQKIEAIQVDTKGAVEAIKEIGGVINQISDISNTIAGAVEEQTATTNEISRNVAEAAKGSSEIAQNITAVAQAAAGATEGAGNTQKAAQELSHIAAELQRLVSQARV